MKPIQLHLIVESTLLATDYDDRRLFCTFAPDSRGEVQFLTGGIVHNSHSGTDMV